jgi:alpha-ribazole phosphatase
MNETRLWLVRHAPVAGARGVIHAPEAPADLGDTSTLALLRALLPVGAAAFASPARRTVETAQALALAPALEPAFREQHFGDWTGRRHDDLARELGEAYRAFWRASATNHPPGGESFREQIERVGEGVRRLPAGDVVLVVHSGTIRSVLAIALDITPDAALRLVVDPLSLTRIDRLDDAWRVVCVNR